ncbi:hypothetical protein ARALYDRAFT_481573 [Arabidopsis lyrata subsp. lyrata]|uniref:Uncharacterized protein n=1 Tax=Arabidopsis lyrata subsp. lyrata TaxID=81972 RepID=D7LFF5_ARALL|nr:hypothetical protein ARALYDRAFT_481573 [Arabidopsis lyrata subsp. lyrata]
MSMGKKHLNINSLNYQNPQRVKKTKKTTTARTVSSLDYLMTLNLQDSYHRVYDEQNDDVGYDGDGDDDEGSRMDMRVLMVYERAVLLKSKDEFLGFFSNIGDAVSQFKQDSRSPTKSMTMQRSLSAGSSRVTSKGVKLGPSDLRDERFKVTTVNAGGAAGGGKGGSAAGQGQTKKQSGFVTCGGVAMDDQIL